MGKRLKLVSAIFLVTLVLAAMVSSGTFVYIVYASPTSSMYVEEGVYPSAVAWTIWKEGSSIYAKDANGHIPSWAPSSNATVIINNAIDDSALGTRLILPGEYEVYSIQFDSDDHNKTLQGMGWGKTILKRADSTNAYVLDIQGVTGVENFLVNVGVKDLEIDCNEANQVADDYQHGIFMCRCNDSFVENVWIHDVGEGSGVTTFALLGKWSYRLRFEGNLITNTEDGGFGFETSEESYGIKNTLRYIGEHDAIWVWNSNHTHIESNHIWYAGFHGIHLYNKVFHSVVSHNTIYYATAKGIQLGHTEYSACDWNVVSDNTLMDISGYGIRLVQDSSFNTISNNVMKNCTLGGIRVSETSSNNIYSGNNLYGNPTSNGGHGIILKDENHHNIIIGNVVQYFNGSGITLWNNSFNNTVIGCIALDCGTYFGQPAYTEMDDFGTNNKWCDSWNGTTWIGSP